METKEIAREITDKLKSLKPNEVVTLSPESGKFLLETIRQMKENKEI
jgi:hypothetical protein